MRSGEIEERPLLIFDQFEEWVTRFEDANAHEARDRILHVLVKLLNDAQLPVKILLSLREDYLARLEPIFKRCPALPDHYLRLTALDGCQVQKVIRGPFEKHPGVWKSEISPDLAQVLRAQLEEQRTSEGIPPTEVQIVCFQLFKAGERGENPAEFFKTQEGVQGLLERFLEESLQSLESVLRDPAVALLTRMLTSAGTRNVISRDDLTRRVELEDELPQPLLEQALDALEEKTRLVRRELRRDVYFYEIVSEFLVDWIHDRAEERRVERAKTLVAMEERARQREDWIRAQAEKQRLEREMREQAEQLTARRRHRVWISVTGFLLALVMAVALVAFSDLLSAIVERLTDTQATQPGAVPLLPSEGGRR